MKIIKPNTIKYKVLKGKLEFPESNGFKKKRIKRIKTPRVIPIKTWILEEGLYGNDLFKNML